MPDIHRHISEEALRHYDLLREGAAALDTAGWAAIELTGEDRKGWLQGQATNDVKTLTEGNSRSFCLCEATGQLLSVVDAWALDDRIVMTVPRETAAAVLARVEAMTIMEDVAARDLSEEYAIVSVQGPTATRDLAEFVPLPALDAGTSIAEFVGSRVFVLRSNRAGLGGWDVWVPREASVMLSQLRLRYPMVSPDAYEATRLEAGIPKWGTDMGPKTLPPELGAAFEARHVSYKKGCYTGQEILMRMHSRGHTNKTWTGLVADGPLAVGDEVLHRGKGVGTVLSAAFSPDYGGLGAAALRNEAVHDGEAVLVGGVEAEVRRMPILRMD